LTVDFADGSTASTIIVNGAIVTATKTINYTTTGAKTLKFTVTYSDNTTLTTYGYVYVNVESNLQTFSTPSSNSGCYETIKEKGTFTSNLPYQGYTESSPVYGKTEYTIFYADNNTAKLMLNPLLL
jgi:hypothetical protein